MTSYLSGAHDFSLNELKVVNVAPSIGDPLHELASHIAAGALHDSDERCDAPKCHPETRVAVQDEIYGWIIHGDPDPEQKITNIKWVTGPAGTGKSAIIGSLADTCKENGRRTKTAFIPTLAYQLARHLPGLKDPVGHAMQDDPLLFKKNLRVQMEALILMPLRRIAVKPTQPGVVLVDGLDECEAEQYLDTHAPSSRGPTTRRTQDEDQLEILQVLWEASLDPAFPFRIIIASRPERVFREFFENDKQGSPLVPPLVLDEKYNPDADIALFLQAKFSEIRRRYKLSASWPSPEILATLLDQASGQFIYAATIIRYITTSRQGNPQILLDRALKAKSTSPGTNPFSYLDSFYTHILQSAPDPILAVKWLWVIKGELPDRHPLFSSMGAALLVNLLLQSDDGDAEHVLGDLHSLINIPPSDDLESPYRAYHKSLYDYLGNEGRCGPLYVNDVDGAQFIWDRMFNICKRESTSITAGGLHNIVWY
ncbi:hypothetical protein H1R20_g10509, partial [Candolleomyces eurysporus]